MIQLKLFSCGDDANSWLAANPRISAQNSKINPVVVPDSNPGYISQIKYLVVYDTFFTDEEPIAELKHDLAYPTTFEIFEPYEPHALESSEQEPSVVSNQ